MKACSDCHQQPIIGGISQVAELRAGKHSGQRVHARLGDGESVRPRRARDDCRPIAHQSGSDLSGGDRRCRRQPIFNFPDTDAHERIGKDSTSDNIRSLRTTTNILGDGFVEVIADSTLLGITATQRATPAVTVGTFFHPASIGGVNQSAGENTIVDLLERPGNTRVGRFGWKAQLASLVSFAGGAYLNEQGITNRIVPHEVTGDGVLCDTVADPEDADDDVTTFARFMRTTKPQSRDVARAATPDAQAGSVIFNQIGCNFCHTRSITTAPAGTTLAGVDNSFTPGVDLVVSAAMGDKIIHPFSDFALHDVTPTTSATRRRTAGRSRSARPARRRCGACGSARR